MAESEWDDYCINDVANSVEMSTMLQGDRRIVTQLTTVTLLNPQQNYPTLITNVFRLLSNKILH